MEGGSWGEWGDALLIPFQHVELERIYTQTLAGKIRSLAVTAANSGEGVTTLAISLTQRNLMAGRSTLLVDLNLWNPSLSGILDLDQGAGKQQLLPPPQIISSGESSLALMGVTAPTRRDVLLKLREPGVLKECIEEWHREYDSIIIDTSPLNRINSRNIPAERVAAACGGAILVVLAGRTNEAMVESAVKKLHEAEARLLGTVINDQCNPGLREELLRETLRLKRLPRLATWFRRKIQQAKLLSLEV